MIARKTIRPKASHCGVEIFIMVPFPPDLFR
jgi:hypothetical protein